MRAGPSNACNRGSQSHLRQPQDERRMVCGAANAANSARAFPSLSPPCLVDVVPSDGDPEDPVGNVLQHQEDAHAKGPVLNALWGERHFPVWVRPVQQSACPWNTLPADCLSSSWVLVCPALPSRQGPAEEACHHRDDESEEARMSHDLGRSFTRLALETSHARTSACSCASL